MARVIEWFRLDVDFATHPKVLPLSDRAFRFYVAMIAYCAANLTDGRVSNTAVRQIAIGLNVRVRDQLSELVRQKLCQEWSSKDGYTIHGYLDKQQSRQQAKARSEAAKKASLARWGNAESIAERIASGKAEGNARTYERSSKEGVLDKDPVARIEQMIANGALHDLVHLNAELRAAGLNGEQADLLRQRIETTA